VVNPALEVIKPTEKRPEKKRRKEAIKKSGGNVLEKRSTS
jgi:hypothetical protein